MARIVSTVYSVEQNTVTMIMKWYLLFSCALFSTYEAAYVDTLHACPLNDPECLKNFMQSTLKDLSSNGIPEYNIPPIDPLEIKELEVPVLNLMNITIKDGLVKGVKDCVVNKFEILAEKGEAVIDMLCDIEIKGKSKILGSSPDLEIALGSQSISGDGNFEMKFSKLQTTLIFRYHLLKKDGEVYFKFHQDEFRYTYELGDAHISADGIYLGEKDESKLVVDYLNKNWPLLIKTFGGNIFDVAMNIIQDKLVGYSDNVPTKYFISDDLSSYVK